MGKIWDISQVLRPELPVWPGEPAFSLEQHAEISESCPVNVGGMQTGLHAGTHADAPFHYAKNGPASADCDLEPYIGRCVLIDVTGAVKRVEMNDCDWGAIVGHSRVLLRTYNCFPHEAWDSQFKAIAPDVIGRMGEAGVKLIGVDAPSLDPETSKTMDAHHQVLAHDMRILEGLVLDDVPYGAFELVALPLRIAGADASPVRAILREIAE
ncbi:MAG: arylformamidase [Erythrobacter sp.]